DTISFFLNDIWMPAVILNTSERVLQMNLLDIQPVVQQIADAIASVLKIEVEIANHEFIRVAGTGEHKTSVLHKMEGDLVYQAAIRTGQSVIIEHPGFEEVCKRCHFYQNCPETGEICTPIF